MISTRDETLSRLFVEALELQRRARDHFGDSVQDIKTAEECSELVTILLQSQSRDVSQPEVTTEAADAFFTVVGLLDSLNGWRELERKMGWLRAAMDSESSGGVQ